MAITAYGLKTNSQGFTLLNGSLSAVTVAGPWLSGGQVTDIATLTSSVNVLGFTDGENRAKYLFSSSSGSVNLPTLSAVPNSVPAGAIPLGSSGTGFVYAVVGANTNASTYPAGGLYFQLTPAPGSPDGSSPMEFLLDPYALLLVDSATAEWA